MVNYAFFFSYSKATVDIYIYDSLRLILFEYFWQISTDQTSSLGAKPRYMRKMLQLVKSKVESNAIDITLKFTLSALWNLTGLELFNHNIHV